MDDPSAEHPLSVLRRLLNQDSAGSSSGLVPAAPLAPRRLVPATPPGVAPIGAFMIRQSLMDGAGS
jgi:hypothetical protein